MTSKLIWRFCQILWPSQNIWTLYKPILHWTRGPNFIDLVKVAKTTSSIEELGRLEDVLYWQKLGCQQHLRSLFRELQHLLLPSSRTKLYIRSTLNISLFHQFLEICRVQRLEISRRCTWEISRNNVLIFWHSQWLATAVKY